MLIPGIFKHFRSQYVRALTSQLDLTITSGFITLVEEADKCLEMSQPTRSPFPDGFKRQIKVNQGGGDLNANK